MKPHTYYITFGQKYSYEKHPQGGHPDGWFEVQAMSPQEARTLAFARLADKWSSLYSEKPDKRLYPLGKIGEIS